MPELDSSVISNKLDTLIRLIALLIIDGKPQNDQIRLLAQGGLYPKEIAEILGTTSNTVSVTLSQQKKDGISKKKSVGSKQGKK